MMDTAMLRVMLIVVGLSSQGLLADEGGDFFERHVRPVLVAKCLECHGDESPEGGLRLTSRTSLFNGGQSGPAALEKKPAESLLIQAIEQRGKLKMPPDGKLTDSEIASLTKWVELGAPWPETTGKLGKPRPEFAITDADRQHWSFQLIANPPIPSTILGQWRRNSIDGFVLSKFEKEGLKPAPAADRRTLIRRAYIDMIGIPPTWDETQAFVQDPLPTDEAFVKVVDFLLQSPRYGERWGRHWLDVARYADTKDGVLMYGDDRIRPYAYTYRDYVIRALNEDTPFDKFIHEQLAADLIEPKVEPWRLAAMGYLTLGRMFDNNIHDIIDDQIDTVSRGFLGLTVSCARCHDHKYDPVSTADYYSLYGVFASSEVPLDLPAAGTAATADAIEFEKQYVAKRDDVRNFRDQQFTELTETARSRIGDYLIHVATTKPDPLETAIFFLSLAPEDLRPPVVARWRRLLEQTSLDKDPVFLPWHLLLAGDVKVSALEPEQVARARQQWDELPAGTKAGQINPFVREALNKATLSTRSDVGRVYGDLLKRLYEESKSSSSEAEPSADEATTAAAKKQLLELVVGRDNPLYFPKSQTRRYMSRQQTDQYGGKLQELDRMAVKSVHATPRAMVLNDAESPFNPRIFVRGNPTQLGNPVDRQFLQILSGPDRKPFGPGSGRLDLARAIGNSKNPLTARVMVNRVWMHHFGEPLVSTPSDFGKRSTPPVHAELLDHLATEFIKRGWSLKSLHRMILLSATWQQSTTDRESRNLDVALAPRSRRLSFEAMRDSLLAISGRLEHRDGGRPIDIADPLSRCRTVYGLVDRQSLPGMFRAFDFASPDQSVERRPRTMVPQQALFALNSPFVIEQAKGLMLRSDVVAVAGIPERIVQLYRIVFTREPTLEEIASCTEFLTAPQDATSTLSRWEQLAQVLLCSNELMYVD